MITFRVFETFSKISGGGIDIHRLQVKIRMIFKNFKAEFVSHIPVEGSLNSKLIKEVAWKKD